jgi:hypothetical protein
VRLACTTGMWSGGTQQIRCAYAGHKQHLGDIELESHLSCTSM